MRAAIHVSFTCYGSHHLCHPLRNIRVAPEELAGFRIDADDALAQKLDVLSLPTCLNDYRRRVTGGISSRNFRFPNDRASPFVEGNYGGLCAARCYDYDVTIN